MIYSRSTQYAIQTLAFLATRAPGEYARARDIARWTDVPLPFLFKITRTLRNRGLVQAVRGLGGGIRLARAPREIKLADVVLAIEGPDRTGGCVLGLSRCDEDEPCAVHAAWEKLRADLQALHQRTLADLAGPLARRQGYAAAPAKPARPRCVRQGAIPRRRPRHRAAARS